MMSKILLAIAFIILCMQPQAQQKTYCNPINIDYNYTPYVNNTEFGKHRATADPVIVMHKGDYYLFSTNAQRYWWSNDLYNWNFIPRIFLNPWHTGKGLNAPAVWLQSDTLLVFGSTYTRDYPIWMSTNPKANEWSEAIDSLDIGGWDPDVFLDDDGRW